MAERAAPALQAPSPPADAPLAGPPLTHLLYLHGFRSSPRSFKAQRLADWVAAQRPDLVWCCPQLPPDPDAALALIDALTGDWPAAGMAVIGSSLGGFYACVVAEARGCRALLLNPAVDPARDLARHIGRLTAWHDPALSFDFGPEHVAALRAMAPATLHAPQRYAALIAEGDEVLDAAEMRARHAAAAGLRVIPGSDHALSDFDAHLPWLIATLGLAPAGH
ncbi:YqiA/YcfP family alpha/beta fold hydrolase [Pseudaquabacterium rugosum]|uniref:YqiA/YcfP family alpha/beta fold hydrolase n=1 Tax=Pseudaquabacterium rugosum TaxID=2984194 RepID=A0ABU9B4N4_9BURK